MDDSSPSPSPSPLVGKPHPAACYAGLVPLRQRIQPGHLDQDRQPDDGAGDVHGHALGAIGSADIVLFVLDGSQPFTAEDRRVLDEIHGKHAIAVINKSDLPRRLEQLKEPEAQVAISCRTGYGLDDLKRALSDQVKQGTIGSRGHVWAVNQRHKTALEQAKESLQRALESATGGLSQEFVALDLLAALDSLGMIIGATYTEDILERIFNDFCIGK